MPQNTRASWKYGLTHLHWNHWLIVLSSIILTFVAGHVAYKQQLQRKQTQYQLESLRLIELVKERLEKYESGLRAGVAAIKMNQGQINREEWRIFSENLNLGQRFPGIHGIGVIFYLPHEQKNIFLKKHRQQLKSFNIHPTSTKEDYWIITYIEPVVTNGPAVGLDISFEVNRFDAAVKARDTASPQITAPIILVQDESHNPGFLFYQPFYFMGKRETLEERRTNFLGLIYAPFVAQKLMQGALLKQHRNISFNIQDGDFILYQEIDPNHPEYDSNAVYEQKYHVPVYGRDWIFTIRTNKNFQNEQVNILPKIIWAGGLIIDLLLFAVFIIMARTTGTAWEMAKKLQLQAEERRRAVEHASKMASLGQMAAGIAHEINNPLAVISGNAAHLALVAQDEEIKREELISISQNIEKTSNRIAKIIRGLRAYSKGASSGSAEKVEVEKILTETVALCWEKFKINQVDLKVENLAPNVQILCQPVEISQVLLNLLNNAYDAIKNLPEKWIKIQVTQAHEMVQIAVIDSGKGIPEELKEKILRPFFTTKPAGEGTGIGLSICDDLMKKNGGKLTLKSDAPNTTFIMELPIV